MLQNHPYDLLVEDSVKIDVKVSKMYKGTNGNFYSFNLERQFGTCDLYILFLVDAMSRQKDVLIIPSKDVMRNTQISVGENKSKYYRYSQKWEYIDKMVDFQNEL